MNVFQGRRLGRLLRLSHAYLFAYKWFFGRPKAGQKNQKNKYTFAAIFALFFIKRPRNFHFVQVFQFEILFFHNYAILCFYLYVNLRMFVHSFDSIECSL